MKSLLLILLLSSGCSTHFESPLTHIKYKGEVSEEGISVLAKPPFWDAAVWCWEYITD